MIVPHVEIVKEKLGVDHVRALEELFSAAGGKPPSVPAERFRADHHQWLDVLNDLERRHSLIERSQDSKSYLLRSYALPLIEEAISLVEMMDGLYLRLRELYPK